MGIMAVTLSIIIPVFNAHKTLAAAVASIYRQELKIPFEIIMVDDGSSDNSRELMSALALQHSEIKNYFHEKNLGGGATRNSAVDHSQGRFIFCLDSDDMMGDNMMMPMVKLITDKRLDGVGVHISQKFSGNNPQKIAFINTFGYAGKIIPFESLFEGSECALYSTFLHTRSAFKVCGGYPTHHGFDTQGFAFRFLANGLKASVAPQTTYLHRINSHRSYYVREAEAGRVGENCQKIYEEFFYFFSPKMQEKMLSTNLHSGGLLPAHIGTEKEPLVANYKSLIQAGTQEKYQQQLLQQKSLKPFDAYWLGCQFLQANQSELAISHFLSVIKSGQAYERVKNQLISALVMSSGLPVSELFSPLAQKKSLSNQVTLTMIQKRNDLIRLVRQFI